MLSIYLDESGDRNSSWLIMSGLVSTPEKWLRFESAWKQALEEYRVPYFHMKEFQSESRTSPYAHLTQQHKDVLLIRLISLVKRRCVLWVGSPLDAVAYRQVIRGDLVKKFGDPYYSCFRECINAVLIYCQKNRLTDRLAFFVDGQKKLADRAKSIYAQYKELDAVPCRQLLGPMVYADDKQYPGLQAADLVSWELGRRFRNPQHNRQSFLELCKMPFKFIPWDRKRLIHYRNEVRPQLDAIAAKA